MSQKNHLAAVFDCRTIIVGYYNNIIIQLACTCAYNIDDLFHTGRIDPPGMEKVVYIVCVHQIYTWPLDSRKAWAANIAIELNGFPAQAYRERQTVDYINIESENQKSGLVILLVLFHSACPYKNYCLKCFTELQTLFI